MKEQIPWEVTVRRISNGYTIIWKEELANEVINTLTHAIVEDELDEAGAAKALMNLGYFLQEHFGEYSNKYSQMVLKLALGHGHKYECTDPKCDMEECLIKREVKDD